MEILRGFIDQVIASLALISSVLSRQNEILNTSVYFSKLRHKIFCDVDPTSAEAVEKSALHGSPLGDLV